MLASHVGFIHLGAGGIRGLIMSSFSIEKKYKTQPDNQTNKGDKHCNRELQAKKTLDYTTEVIKCTVNQWNIHCQNKGSLFGTVSTELMSAEVGAFINQTSFNQLRR